jgi:serine/threonine protein kinase
MATTTYGERWQNLGSLAEGGQSFVFRVSDQTGVFPGEWALKRLKEIDRVERFAREVAILRKFPHENIVELIDAQVNPNGKEAQNYLVMPIAANGSPAKRLPIYKDQIGSTIEVTLQIARALAFLHEKRVVHRDIKPGNILFPEAGHKVWVADFGLGYDPESAWKSPVGEVIGPRGFTAPELETGHPGEATPSADIYSLGRLIFFMISGGQHIAREDALDQKYDSVFAKGERYTDLRLLLSRMVALQPSRIQDMNIVIDELKRLQSWEQNAVSLVLGKNNLSTIDQLKRQSAEALAIRNDNIAARKTEDEIFSTTFKAVESWLTTELTELSDHVKAEGAIVCAVIKPPVASGATPFVVQTGLRNGVTSSGGVGIEIELLSDPFHQKYALSFLIGNDRSVSIQMHEKRMPAADPAMAILPVFTQTRPEHPDMVQFTAFIAGHPVRHGVSDPIRRGPGPTTSTPQVHLHQTYHDGWMDILRFKASEWPAAQTDLVKLVDDGFQKFFAHIQSPYKAFGP